MKGKILMDAKDYHSREAIGSSLLKSIHTKTIHHAIKEEFDNTKDNIVLGNYVHALVLEPETVGRDFAILPEVDGRTKEGKAIKEQFALASANKTILKSDLAQKGAMIKESLLMHPMVRKMLAGAETEYSYFCDDPDTGLKRKCRPDIKNGGALIDLKTCTDASFEGFARQVGGLAYHLQAAYYLDTHNLATGEDLKDFFFVAAETKDPFAVAVYQLSADDIEAGRLAYKQALKRYSDFITRAKEVGEEQAVREFSYSQDITVLSIPYWFHDKIKNDA